MKKIFNFIKSYNNFIIIINIRILNILLIKHILI